jgi:hypothetical protein
MTEYQRYKKWVEVQDGPTQLANRMQLLWAQEQESQDYLHQLDMVGKGFVQGFYTYEEYEDQIEQIKKYYGRYTVE